MRLRHLKPSALGFAPGVSVLGVVVGIPCAGSSGDLSSPVQLATTAS